MTDEQVEEVAKAVTGATLAVARPPAAMVVVKAAEEAEAEATLALILEAGAPQTPNLGGRLRLE